MAAVHGGLLLSLLLLLQLTSLVLITAHGGRAHPNVGVAQFVRKKAGGHVVPLRMQHGWVRRRGLLRDGRLPIQGAVREFGYFYATLLIGTPARKFELIIDTGSTMTYVPCADCKHCGKHRDAAFNASHSSTVKVLDCVTPLCNCGSPSCQCVSSRCYYSRSYAERSSSAGFLLEDVYAFPDAHGPVKLVFGCEQDETGEIFRQVADGLLGMGNNNNAFPSQLVDQKVIENTFSLCFGYPSGGTMLLGDVRLTSHDQMQYTPLHPGHQPHYYTVIMEGIDIAGARVNVPPATYAVGYGAVLDSGTTFTYIPSAAFKALSQAVDAYVQGKGLKRVDGDEPQYHDICWGGAPENGLHTVFPPMVFAFQGNATIRMTPMQFLFKASRKGTYCLGIFDNGQGGTLIGGISVRNVLVQYDRRHHRVGFLAAPCNDLPYAPEPSTTA